jgi:hypothetical protein
MRTIEELPLSVISDLDTAHIVHGAIMDEIVETERVLERNLHSHVKIYYNSKLDTLISIYGLINDIMWEKEKLDRKNNDRV